MLQVKNEWKCPKCGSLCTEEEISTHEDRWFCSSCFQSEVGDCHTCGNLFWRRELTAVEDSEYCPKCLGKRFVRCAACEEYEERDRARYSDVRERDYCLECFSEYVEFCRSCDIEIDGDNCSRNDNGDGFCDDCFQDEDGSDQDYIQEHECSGVSFKRCLSRRKYGVEIEACLNDPDGHMDNSELGYWSRQRDGSLGKSGREYSSPILQGDEGFEDIERLTTRLKGRGYHVRNSCGLHVHIDGRDLDFQDIKKLLKLVLVYEPVLYAMLPEARFTGTYSVPLRKFPRSRFRIRVQDEASLKAMWYGRDRARVDTKSKYHHSRYFGLNIHSWFFRRSLEFRYHSGTLNPAKITNFISICQAFVDRAKAVKSVRAESFKSFKEQLERFIFFFGLSDELSHYIKQRILKFHPDRLAPVSTN